MHIRTYLTQKTYEHVRNDVSWFFLFIVISKRNVSEAAGVQSSCVRTLAQSAKKQHVSQLSWGELLQRCNRVIHAWKRMTMRTHIMRNLVEIKCSCCAFQFDLDACIVEFRQVRLVEVFPFLLDSTDVPSHVKSNLLLVKSCCWLSERIIDLSFLFYWRKESGGNLLAFYSFPVIPVSWCSAKLGLTHTGVSGHAKQLSNSTVEKKVSVLVDGLSFVCSQSVEERRHQELSSLRKVLTLLTVPFWALVLNHPSLGALSNCFSSLLGSQ